MKINKKFKKKSKKIENILLIMIGVYILGVLLGCFFIYIDKDSSSFLLTIIKNSASISIMEEVTLFSFVKNLFNDILFFSLIFLFKYAGVLKVLTSSVPLFFGIKNAIQYCMANVNGVNLIEILASFTIRDTAISFLLILCTSAAISEIIKQRDNIKYDMKMLLAYICATSSIYVIDTALKLIILA